MKHKDQATPPASGDSVKEGEVYGGFLAGTGLEAV